MLSIISQAFKRWLARNSGEASAFLIILLALFSAGSLYKYEIISIDLQKDKDKISALSSLITAAIAIVVACFSYYRFFRGRLYSVCAEIETDISIHDSKEGFLLHAIMITIKNTGTIPIWHPVVALEFKKYFPNKEQIGHIDQIDDGSIPSKTLAIGVQPQETIALFASQNVTDKVFAVKYSVRISTANGFAWYTSKTITNRV